MTSRYKAYPEYRSSGVFWLDKVPSHWIVNKVKRLTNFQVGWTPSTGNDENFVGDNLWANISDLKEKYLHQTAKNISDEAARLASMDITPKGSLLYSFKLSVGSVSFAQQDMYTNEAIASFLSSSQLPLEYLYYSLPIFVIQNASTNIYGARILNQELIKNAFLLEPSYKEAEKIANFLDHETAKIDTLIVKQEKLIGLLKEKRQAVIYQAVTKGISYEGQHDVPMKHSGVEWLGEVPKHWGVGRLKNVLRIRNGKDYKHVEVESGGYPVYGSGGIFKRSSEYLFDGESVLFGRKGTIDKPLVVKGKFWTVDTMFYSELHKHTDAQYIHSQSTLFPFGLLSTNTALPSMTQEDLLELGFAIPPHEEQLAISEAVSSYNRKFSHIIEKAAKQINLMKERKTALISAAVTGKIDVRDWNVVANS
ncbi:restriction endonuclease subunit S [Shewanella frigidimarina]|uniref:restriction endonuclease subunit S n=1 Tax=Shewanella frigidimarina TaxID=56812 RepID=UPI003D795007